MKNNTLVRLSSVVTIVLAITAMTAAQRAVSKPPKAIVFAVLNDGKMLEPIAYVNKGKLAEPVNGSDDQTLITGFNKAYYKPGTVYRLIFGGANAGNVTVKSSDAKAECSRNMATASTRSNKTPLQGLVMGLATNAPIKTASASYRRRPTTAEKDEIDALAKAEFMRQKLTPGTLRYQNLTALDLDRDGKAEFVGSYWVEIDRLTRGLLFFIAAKASNGKYALGYKEYRSVDQANVMSGDIKNVDEGVYHELLLDAFDYDGDGTSEVFTYIQSFEGAGFSAYRKSGSKWEQSYTTSNYHCGY